MFHLLSLSPVSPGIFSTSGIEEVFITSTETTVYSQFLPSKFFSSKKPGETEILADSVINVKLCVGEGVKYCLSSTCTLFLSAYNVQNVSNLVSLCDTVSNLA